MKKGIKIFLIVILVLFLFACIGGGVFSFYAFRAAMDQTHLDDKITDANYLIDKTGEYEEALGLIEEVVADQPDNQHAYGAKCKALRLQEKYKDAIVACNKAIELDSDYSQAYFYRAYVYSYMDDHKKAIADATRAIDKSPNNVDAYVARCWVYSYDKKYKEAVKDCDKAISLSPTEGAFFQRGVAYQNLGEEKKAIADYSRVLEMNPDHKLAQEYLDKL